MKGHQRFLGGYLCTGATYGLIRSVYLTHGAQIKEYSYDKYPNKEYKFRPMLIAEKAPVCIMGTTAASFYWPFYVIRDVYDMEMSIRGLADEFGDKDRSNKIYSSALDVVFG